MFSTGFSWPKLHEALRLIFKLDYSEQYERSQAVLSRLTDARHLFFESDAIGTKAILDFSNPFKDLYLFNQSGPIEWGRQSVLPNGEVSLLTDGHGQYSSESKFNLDGDLPLLAYPVLHRGACPCAISRAGAPCSRAAEDARACSTMPTRFVSSERHEHVFWSLARIGRSRAVVRVRAGTIVELTSPNRCDPSIRMLSKLMEEDENYRKVHEIGFGLNDGFLFQGNFLPNEMRAGVHFGLGLTPFTEFHLDFVCSSLSLVVETNEDQRIPLFEHTFMNSRSSWASRCET
jgi:hypothetical protein